MNRENCINRDNRIYSEEELCSCRSREEELCSRMSLEEKTRLVNGASFFGMADFEKLGIPRMQLLDGGTGINFEQLFGDMAEIGNLKTDSTNGMVGSTVLMHVIEYYFEPEKLNTQEQEVYYWIKERLEKNLNGVSYAPSCFPPGMLLGATWNPQVIYKVGEALGREANLYGIHILLGTPNVNIHRDPLNGRLFEGYSEDPCLVSKLAPALVKGVQKYGVAANIKHFAANNQETNRVGINEMISKRALEEIYLPGFAACVKEGKAQTVMSAYQKINGVACTENKFLLTEKLRDEWGFEGAVISDWGAVYHPVEALSAGNDLAMPGPIDFHLIKEAVEQERLSEKVLDEAVCRLLKVIHWVEQNFVSVSSNQKAIEALYIDTTKAAYEAAAEGIVMLRNDGVFPLKEGVKVAIVGSGANKLMECGSGSAGITTDRTSSLADTLIEGEVSVSMEKILPDTEIIVCVCKVSGMEGNDRSDLYLLKEDRELLTKIKQEKGNRKVTLILNTCGPVDLRAYGPEWVESMFAVFLPGMEGGHALGDILLGRRNPSGKLPLTFPNRYEDTPTFLNFPGDGYEVNYGEGIYVGYRYYDKKKVKTYFPFGFGLSYTDFSCSNIEMTGDLRFEVQLKNIGKIAGSQVVQLYIADPFSTLSKPVKELKAF
ncbi:MAG: hypothetical protein GX567_05085, partial [Clostridia bacterium]|nr:hypothetical protein [Clostridia bacterium]